MGRAGWTEFGQGHSGARREHKAQPLTAMHLALSKEALLFLEGIGQWGLDTKTQYSKKLSSVVLSPAVISE